ncbi:hypothetical protein WJX74_004633 [Apatococcus lobatus]|uniref:Pterin-binding domain-containing protein n=1 Tax=Apatococcus lobatus TaxID=904363 RepID=A0AAW1Q9G5_9CHLO
MQRQICALMSSAVEPLQAAQNFARTSWLTYSKAVPGMRWLRVLSQFARSYSTEGHQMHAVKDVVVAIGANQGQRYQNFILALDLLQDRQCQVARYSRLYETAPAYVTDQDPFLNAAVLLRTYLPPEALLRTLKDVEAELGRKVKAKRWGPRPIDLDIIFYHGEAFSSSALQVPHPRWHERSFVLAPLADLLSHDELDTSAFSMRGATARSATQPFSYVNKQDLDKQCAALFDELQDSYSRQAARLKGQSQFLQDLREQFLQQQPTEGSISSNGNAESSDELAKRSSQLLSHAAPAILLQQVLSAMDKDDMSQQAGTAAESPAAVFEEMSEPGTIEMCGPGAAEGLCTVVNTEGDQHQLDRREIHEGLRLQLLAAKQHWDIWQARASAGVQSQGDVDIQCVLPLGDESAWAWEGRSHVMGILNITPDSFSDGGQYTSSHKAVEQARRLVAEGATMLDVGGQSTRPHALYIEPDEELRRVLPVIRALVEDDVLRATTPKVLISIDTFHAKVAAGAIEAGAHIVNDVSGGSLDPDMYSVVAKLGVPYIIMHMRGNPRTMQYSKHITYRDICAEVAGEVNERVQDAVAAGIKPWMIITDPGIGFSKTAQGCLELMAGLQRFRQELQPPLQKMPILAGPSRKRFLGNIIGSQTNEAKDRATAVAASVCVANSADIIRAHNAAAVRDALDVADAIRASMTPPSVYLHGYLSDTAR